MTPAVTLASGGSRLRPVELAKSWAPALLFVAALSAAPFVAGSYGRFVAVLVLINVVAVTGVNISMGLCGLVSVGHAGFMAIGAYVAAALMNNLEWGLAPSLAAGALAAAAAGVVIGLPALRLNSLYIAMVTFGFGQAVNLMLVNWIEVTGGPNGMPVLVPDLFGAAPTPARTYLVVAAAACASVWVARNIMRTRLGRAFLGIRDSEIAAQAMGVSIARTKTIAFAISAFYGGLAGGLYAIVAEYVNPDAFVFGASVSLVTMCVAGGLGTLWGPVLGAVILTVLPELLRPVAEYKEVLSGTILLGVLVLMPRGLVPLLGEGAAKLLRPRAGAG